MFGFGPWELLILIIFFVVVFVGLACIIFFPVRALLKSQPPGQQNNPAERLKEIEKLKGAGLITEDEFDKKRSEILSDL
jgi:uncharacterized membrane protein